MSRSLVTALRRPALAVGASALALAGLAGCGSDEKKIDLGDGTTASVKQDGEEVTVSTDQGDLKTGEDIDLPDSFPSDLVLPQGDHTVVSSLDSNGQLMVTLHSDEFDLAAEQEYLKSELAAAGWDVRQDSLITQTEISMMTLEVAKGGLVAEYAMTNAEGQLSTAIIAVGQAR